MLRCAGCNVRFHPSVAWHDRATRRHRPAAKRFRVPLRSVHIDRIPSRPDRAVHRSDDLIPAGPDFLRVSSEDRKNSCETWLRIERCGSEEAYVCCLSAPPFSRGADPYSGGLELSCVFPLASIHGPQPEIFLWFRESIVQPLRCVNASTCMAEAYAATMVRELLWKWVRPRMSPS